MNYMYINIYMRINIFNVFFVACSLQDDCYGNFCLPSVFRADTPPGQNSTPKVRAHSSFLFNENSLYFYILYFF